MAVSFLLESLAYSHVTLARFLQHAFYRTVFTAHFNTSINETAALSVHIRIKSYFLILATMYFSLQQKPIQHVRIFLYTIFSWILSWWHGLHVVHHRSFQLHYSPKISRIPTQRSSQVRTLFCSNFRWEGYESTHTGQILRLCVSSSFGVIVKSFHDWSFLSWRGAQRKVQGILLLCQWYVKYSAFSVCFYYLCTFEKVTKADKSRFARCRYLTATTKTPFPFSSRQEGRLLENVFIVSLIIS